MRGASLCTGIGGAEVAARLADLGVDWLFQSEVERFPCALLKERYPGVPNYGDMNEWRKWPHANLDMLCAGTPCQSFSVAGNRAGMADPRGGLTLEFACVAGRYRPRWILWENVPAVLTANGGRDFGAFVGTLAGFGCGLAWRLLDAQYVQTRSFPRAIPQQRKRVFLVGHSGGAGQRAAAVLFDAESVSGSPPPEREAGGAGRPAEGRAGAEGGDDAGRVAQGVSRCLTKENADGNHRDLRETLVVDAPPVSRCVSAANARISGGRDMNATLVADIPPTSRCLTAGGGGRIDLDTETFVVEREARRLCVTEYERLMGFPDGYTEVQSERRKDGTYPHTPRMKALGNSWAVNCAEWVMDGMKRVDNALGEG